MWTQDHPEAVAGSPFRPPPGAQSISRAATLLQIIAAGRDAGLALSTIVLMTGLTRPTAHRMLAALSAAGLVEQKAKSRRYAIGPQVQLLALARSTAPPLSSAGEAHLDQVASELGDTLFLTVRSGLDSVCVARRLGPFPIQVLGLEVGERRPLGMSSAGIAILAGQSPEEATGVIAANRARLAHHGVNLQQLAVEVEAGRRLGYALRPIGLVRGTAALSVPIRTSHEVAGALTLAAVTHRLSPARLTGVVPILLAAADRIGKGSP